MFDQLRVWVTRSSGANPPNVRRATMPAVSGGASRSLRLDSQGKALGTALLELRLPAPDPEGS